MRRMHLALAVGIFLSALNLSFAQEKLDIKYGKISAADFDLSNKTFDTSVHAVIIAEVGKSDFIGNSKGWFTLIYKRFTRIKILNKNALDEANITVPLFFSGQDVEKLDDLKGATYNLENGKVIETKLDASSVFKDKVNKNLVYKKFTLPAVKEGSIIEYSYTIKSDFLDNLQPWTFQGEYPCLWSEYQTSIPNFFGYVILNQGYLPFHINKRETSFQNYNVLIDNGTGPSSMANIGDNLIISRWVMKDVPPIKREVFTSTVSNYVSKVSFQLSQYRFPNRPVRDLLGNWVTASERMMKSESFGGPLENNNNWLNDEMKIITKGATNDLQKAKNIFGYVRDNFTCTDEYAVYMTGSSTLKTIFKAKSGSVADINLLLIAMLKHEAISASPVILSTRERGLTNELYPLMDKFNYVVCKVTIDSASYFLDATIPMLGFGKLDFKCYNGHARVINANMPLPVYLDADSLMEKKITAVFLMNGDKDKMVGSFTSQLGYYESTAIREKVKEKGIDELFKKMKSDYPIDIDITEKNLDSLKKYDDAIAVRYTFSFDRPQEDLMYINPMMAEGYKENPFKSAERFYPIEMPGTFDETYVFSMEIPEQYTVDEIPKSAKISFNDGEGYFEYLITKNETQIQLRSRVYLKRAVFEADEYQSLRGFFGYVVKKHGEQVVLKKKKP